MLRDKPSGAEHQSSEHRKIFMEYSELIQKTGNIFGLEEWEPDEDGLCSLIAEEAEINLVCNDSDRDIILITSGIIELPVDCPADILTMALDSNYKFAETKGATLSLDKEENMLILSTTVKVSATTPEKLASELEKFASTLLALREKFMEKIQSTSGNVQEQDSGSFGMQDRFNGMMI